MYVNPSRATPIKQIDKLTDDIANAEKHSIKVAPGIYAHLGMLYAQIGDKSSSISAFKKEKELYPESTVMIDGLLTRAFPGIDLDDDQDIQKEEQE